MERITETQQTRKKSPKSQINIPIVPKSEVKIMFICKKNTCCSPMAEFVMKYLVNSAGLSNRVTINSSGCLADPEETMTQGTVKELHRHQIPFIKKNAVQFDESICNNYDYIICMTQENIRDLKIDRRRSKVYLLLDFAGEHRNIFAPTHSGRYSEVYSLIYKGCTALLEHLQKVFANSFDVKNPAEKTILSVHVDEDLLLRFESALMLKNDTIDIAIERFMDNYANEAAKILAGNKSAMKGKTSQSSRNRTENKRSVAKTESEPVNEAEVIEQFVKRWAAGVNQINQRIVKAYFKDIELNGKATVETMKELCNNQKEYPGLYIYKDNGFDNHYRQMKTGSAVNGKLKRGKNIDGKIFWEAEEEVKILTDVMPFVEKYKSYFTQS